MKSLQWLFTGFLLLVLAARAAGQGNPASTGLAPGSGIGIVPGIVSSLSPTGGAGVRGIQGRPFSADVTYEFTHVLDGDNRIYRESHGKIFRDAEGRIRSETVDEMPRLTSLQHITIQDPVSQIFVMLQPQFKSAIVNHIRVRTDGAGHETGIGTAVDDSGGAEPASRAERLEQLKALQHAQKPVPGAIGNKHHREELGTKEIEGITVSGTRYSTTIPAGEIGNEKPIVTVSETWWSEELKAVLVSIHDDPQTGRRVMRLSNIQMGEPDSQLFQIPSDYTLRESPAKPATR